MDPECFPGSTHLKGCLRSFFNNFLGGWSDAWFQNYTGCYNLSGPTVLLSPLVIARAVQSLSKIGCEMYIEPVEDQLVFRTVNMAQSAYSEFKMLSSFFSSFIFNDEGDSIYKVTMRSILSVFKYSHGHERQIECCEIRMKPDSAVVIFLTKFTDSHMKKHYLRVIENERLAANILPEGSNCILVSSKLLSSVIKNFRNNEDEITIRVEPDKAFIKNHIELRRDQHFMRTELSFQSIEFESYTVNNPTAITFCFKELKAVLAFAEPSNLPVEFLFESAGMPMLFKVSYLPAYEVNYIVSTLGTPVRGSMRRSINRNESQINHSQRIRDVTPVRTSLIPESSPIPESTPRNQNITLISSITPVLSDNVNSEYDALESADFNPSTNERTPPDDLVQIVFRRCFTKKTILDNLKEHDEILVPGTQSQL